MTSPSRHEHLADEILGKQLVMLRPGRQHFLDVVRVRQQHLGGTRHRNAHEVTMLLAEFPQHFTKLESPAVEGQAGPPAG